ncbi:hypothetical protein NDU88_003250, partial [Pleurodeles waltl]
EACKVTTGKSYVCLQLWSKPIKYRSSPQPVEARRLRGRSSCMQASMGFGKSTPFSPHNGDLKLGSHKLLH